MEKIDKIEKSNKKGLTTILIDKLNQVIDIINKRFEMKKEIVLIHIPRTATGRDVEFMNTPIFKKLATQYFVFIVDIDDDKMSIELLNPDREMSKEELEEIQNKCIEYQTSKRK